MKDRQNCTAQDDAVRAAETPTSRPASPKLKNSPSIHDSGNRVPLVGVEHSTELVNPGELLDEIVTIIRTYVVMDKEQADAAALWIAMTWFINDIQVAPLAILTAPEKSCGKSQLLTVFGYLVARPLSAANSSASFIFRVIEKSCPTLLIDEADTFLRENGELKGIINAGHTRAQAFVGRTEADGKGGFEPKLFNVWCAKAFAGIGMERHLPPATISRAIMITLRRKMPHESVSRLRHADRSSFEGAASRLANFGKNYAVQIRNARPELPDDLSDRAQDNWEPLLAIAELAGPAWLARAKAAALKLSKSEDDAVSTGNELLADIQDVFWAKKVKKICTADLIQALVSDPDTPWGTYNRGKPLTPRQLAKMLTAYDIRIKSKTVRMGPHDTPKGYELDQFSDAFARYLTPQGHNASETLQGTAKDVAGLTRDTNRDAGGMSARPNRVSDGESPEVLAAIREIYPDFAKPKPDIRPEPFDKRPDSDF